MKVQFYRVNEEYGEFSNFSPHPIVLDGKQWPTTEHYFQAQKFAGTGNDAYMEDIRKAKSPMIAARLGRSRKVKIRRDWEAVKDQVMYRAVLAKFTAHADCRERLLSTGDADLVEETTNDYYWGCGTTGTGKNRLGQILVKVRAELRAGQA